MSTYLQWAEQAVLIAAVVQVATGIAKAYAPKLRSGWTVLLAAVLSYGIAGSHAATTCTGAACVEQGLVVGTIAWGASLGVAWATRLAPSRAT